MLRMGCSLFVVALIVLATSNIQAAEPNGNIDHSALSAMGLPGLQVMSDVEGQKVRGTFAVAWGSGTANVYGNPNATYSTHYLGVGFFAAGGDGDVYATKTTSLGWFSYSKTASAGGSSSAYGF